MPNDWLRSLENAIAMRMEQEKIDNDKLRFNLGMQDQREERHMRERLSMAQLSDNALDREQRALQLKQNDELARRRESLEVLGMESRGEVRKPMGIIGAPDNVGNRFLGLMEDGGQFGVVPVLPEARLLNQAAAARRVKLQDEADDSARLEREAQQFFPDNPFRQRTYKMLKGNPALMFAPSTIAVELAFKDEPDPLKAVTKLKAILDNFENNPMERARLALMQQAQQQQFASNSLFAQAMANVPLNTAEDDDALGRNIIERLKAFATPQNGPAMGEAYQKVLNMFMSRTPSRPDMFQRLGMNGQPQQPQAPAQPQQPTNPQASPSTPPPPPRPQPVDTSKYDLVGIGNRAAKQDQYRRRGIYNVNP